MESAMTAADALEQHRDEIRAVVESHHATNPRVFGSVARGEGTEQSDLDLLVDPQAGMTLFDQGRLIVELERMLGVAVDVVTPAALPESFRGRVLNQAVAV